MSLEKLWQDYKLVTSEGNKNNGDDKTILSPEAQAIIAGVGKNPNRDNILPLSNQTKENLPESALEKTLNDTKTTREDLDELMKAIAKYQSEKK